MRMESRECGGPSYPDPMLENAVVELWSAVVMRLHLKPMKPLWQLMKARLVSLPWLLLGLCEDVSGWGGERMDSIWPDRRFSFSTKQHHSSPDRQKFIIQTVRGFKEQAWLGWTFYCDIKLLKSIKRPVDFIQHLPVISISINIDQCFI